MEQEIHAEFASVHFLSFTKLREHVGGRVRDTNPFFTFYDNCGVSQPGGLPS